MKPVDVIVTYPTDILQTIVWYHSENAEVIRNIMELSNSVSRTPFTDGDSGYPAAYGSVFHQNEYLKKVLTPNTFFFMRSMCDTDTNTMLNNSKDLDVLVKYLSGEIDELPLVPELSKWITPVVESKMFKFTVETFRPKLVLNFRK